VGGEPDSQLTALAAGGGAKLRHGGVDEREHLLRVLEEHCSRRRQLDLARRPDEQRRAELGLERPDLSRERRLSDVQALGCAAEVQLLGDGDEVAEVT
jgi:hypothetical protein